MSRGYAGASHTETEDMLTCSTHQAGVGAYFVSSSSSGRATTTGPQPWVAMNAQRTAAALRDDEGGYGQGEAQAAATRQSVP